jgi:hypothetical protein
MATTSQFKINGLINTSENVLDNLNELANVSGCYLTWDPTQGKWIVILNTTSASVKTFNDSNILGEINVGGTGVNELYNSVIARFPNKDTRDTTDEIQLTIPTADRFAQEIDNVLELNIPIVNEPVQAAYIASRELKQSRLDKIIEFRANFEANTVRAGDVVDITNSALDFANKLFRVIQIEEEDEEDGNLIYSITAQEYDANIYDETVGFNNANGTSGLTYEYRSNFTGIKSKLLSEELDLKDDISIGKQIGGLLAANAALGLINSLFTVDEETGAIINEGKFADPDIQNAITSIAKPTGAAVTKSASVTDVCSGSSVTFSVESSCESCFFDNPSFEYPYTITGVTADEVDVPLTGTITTTGTSAATLVITPTVTSDKTMTVTCDGETTDIDIFTAPTQYVQNVAAAPSTITEGSSSTVTITTVGYPDGTTLNYNIYGNGSSPSRMSAPPTSGTITINSNTATLTIVTIDDGVYDTSKSISVFVGSSLNNPCVISNNQADITVTNNEATGPTPPSVSKPGDFACEYVEVPIIWCGTFDADTQYIKSVNVKKTAFLPVAPTGGTAVPTSLTISNPGEASAAISIASTVNIDPASLGMGGAQIDVITSGFTALGGGDTLITGTITTFNGYWD